MSRYLKAIILLSPLVILLGSHLPIAEGWGFNHLSFLPSIFTVISIIFFLFSLLTNKWEKFQNNFFDYFNKLLFSSNWLLLIIVPVQISIFFLLRAKSHFGGDGYLLLEIANQPEISRLSSGFTFPILSSIARYSFSHYSTTPLLVFQISSCLAGGFLLAMTIIYCGKSSLTPEQKVAYVFLLFSNGASVQFFGYVEMYSWLYSFLNLLFFTELLYFQGKSSLWSPASFSAFAIASHTSAIITLPLLCLTIFTKTRSIFKTFLGILPSILVIVFFVIFAWKTENHPNGFSSNFLSNQNLTHPFKNFYGQFGIFSPNSLVNVFNTIIISSPISIILMVFSKKLRLHQSHNYLYFFFGHLFVVVLLTIFADPKLGASRDWDFFAVHFSIATIPAVILLKSTSRIAPAAIFSSIQFFFPWLLIQLIPSSAIARLETTASIFPPYQNAYAFETIGQYYRNNNIFPLAAEAYSRAAEIQPHNPRFLSLAGSSLISLFRSGVSQGSPSLDCVRDAKQYLEASLELNPNQQKTMGNLAWVYIQLNNFKDAKLCLEQLISLYPINFYWVEQLAFCNYKLGDPEEFINLIQSIKTSAVDYKLSPAIESLFLEMTSGEFQE